MNDQRITQDFWLREFCVSETAERLGKPIEPSPDELANIVRLVEKIMQPIRSALGRPISVSSGLRPMWLNKAVGGAPTSAHITGSACDFTVVGLSPYQVCQWLSLSQLPYSQIIHEYGRWTHIAIAPTGVVPTRQCLTATIANGKTIYRQGILPV